MPGRETRPAAGESSRRRLAGEAIVASLGILAFLAGLKHLMNAFPLVAEHGFTVAVAVELYVPLWLIGRRGITKESLGLSLARWRRDLAAFAVWALVVTVPYAFAHHLWQTAYGGRTFGWAMPDRLLERIVVNLLIVAVAEELFFRGYLQDRLTKLWPAKRRLWGAPFGWGITAASAVFALAHFVGEYRFDRLGPFFPGLAFGWLRAYTGTIWAAVLFHGYCNLLADVLWAFYRG